MLPSPPPWRQRVLHVPGSSTKRPLTLLYRDGLECFEFLFGNPLYFGHCDVAPKRVWTDEERKERLFTEMMTGDMAWDIQVRSLCYSLALVHFGPGKPRRSNRDLRVGHT